MSNTNKRSETVDHITDTAMPPDMDSTPDEQHDAAEKAEEQIGRVESAIGAVARDAAESILHIGSHGKKPKPSN